MNHFKLKITAILLLLTVPGTHESYAGLAIINHSAPFITEASTTLGSWTAPSGSLMGGTEVYIKGSNFEANPLKNAIWIGPYPCLLIADGATESSLACRTTAATDPTKTWNLEITV